MAASLSINPPSSLPTSPLRRPCHRPLVRRLRSRGRSQTCDDAQPQKPTSISLLVPHRIHPRPRPVLLLPPRASSQASGSRFEPDPSREVQNEAVNDVGESVVNAPKSDFNQWDAITSQLSASATLAFLMLQLPQIVLNVQNLISGNTTALFAVQWMGQLTSLLGNLCLLSYFAKKRETGAMVVQAVGVVSTWVVLLQLTMAGAMPSVSFTATSIMVGLGLVLNLLNYKNLLSFQLWGIWEDIITIGSVSVLPQVMWSTFSAVLPPSIVPGTISIIISSTMIALQRLKRLPSSANKFLEALSAWTATLLFMWGAVAQMWSNYLNPENIRGLSVFTVLLAMIGNGLLLPRALFTRDRMWFTGASWGTVLQGWAILATMYMNKCISNIVFWGTTVMLALWLGTIFGRDSKAYSLSSPFSPLVQIYFGTGHGSVKTA